MLQIFLSTFSSFSITFISVYFLIQFLKKNKAYQKVELRKFQRKFIPEFGGLGFGYSMFLNLFIFGSFDQIEELKLICTAIFFVFALGMGDDSLHFRARVKFAVSLLISVFFVFETDYRISTFHGLLGIEMLPDWFSYGFTIFFMMALTHGFNLADGIDGLAGSLAVTVLGILGIWFFVVEEVAFALFSFTLMGGLLAFLKFNWFPAKIFMGDTGSLTLGFSIAILVLLFFNVNERLPIGDPARITASFSMGLMLVGYPVLDTSRVLIRRILTKRNPFKADATHIHHVLLESKLNHGDATKLIGFSHLFLVLVTYEFSSLEDSLLIPIILGFFVLVAVGIEVHVVRLKALKSKLKRQVQLES